MALELLLHCPGYWEAAIAVSQPAVPQRPAVPFPGDDGQTEISRTVGQLNPWRLLPLE